MIQDGELLKLLMRTAASARRDRGGEGEKKKPCSHHRGYGHLLDLLSLERGLCQQEIAERLGVRPQSVSEAIAALLERGMIRKEETEDDRRKALIFLTAAGEEQRAALARDRALRAERLFAGLDDAEREALYTILTKLLDAQKEEKP